MTSSQPRTWKARMSARRPAAASRPPATTATRLHMRLGVGEDVRAEEHRASLIAQLQDERAHVAAAERIEARHRLVQENDFRVVQERLRDADALDHPLRVLAQLLPPPLGADADAVEQRRRALARVGAARNRTACAKYCRSSSAVR